jgi:hypothetical protein
MTVEVFISLIQYWHEEEKNSGISSHSFGINGKMNTRKIRMKKNT